MKACIVGKSCMEFTAGDTGEVVEGVKLYYFAPKDEVDGYFAGELWVAKRSKVYGKVLALEAESPFMAEIDYDMQPGKKRPVSVLTDVRPLDVVEVDELTAHAYWGDIVLMLTALGNKV